MTPSSRVLTLSLLLFTAVARTTSSAQATSLVASLTLPPDTVEVCSVQSASASGGAFHVKAGGSLRLNGEACIVYAESGSRIDVSGGSNAVYVSKGTEGKVNGNGNRIHLINGAYVEIRGKGNRPSFPAAVEVVRLSETVRMAAAAAQSLPAMVPPELRSPPAPPAPPVPTRDVQLGTVVPAPPPVAGKAGTSAPSTAVAPAAQSMKFAPLPPDPAIVSAPGVSTLVALLPMPGDQVAPAPAAPVSDLVGAWTVESLTPEGLSAFAEAQQTTGSMQFRADGLGSLELVIDILGEQIVRRGPFAWSVAGNDLLINQGGQRPSVWSRSAGVGGAQTLKLKGNGAVSATLSISRQAPQ
jgi:hypothetical protein